MVGRNSWKTKLMKNKGRGRKFKNWGGGGRGVEHKTIFNVYFQIWFPKRFKNHWGRIKNGNKKLRTQFSLLSFWCSGIIFGIKGKESKVRIPPRGNNLKRGKINYLGRFSAGRGRKITQRSINKRIKSINVWKWRGNEEIFYWFRRLSNSII